MPNSMNNNTSSIGTIGTRNFSDSGAKEISTAISRGNYQKAVKNDAQMQKFRDYVYKMVTGWALDDKIAIIDAYGDRGQLPPHASEKDINEVCTETIIVHLDPSDLLTLYHDIGKDEVNLNHDVTKLRKQQKLMQDVARKRVGNRRNLSIRNFERAHEYTKYADTEKEYEKKRNEFDPTFHVPDSIKTQYRNLRRELLDVLKTCFNMVEITGIAFRMGIEIPDGVNPKDLYQWIINKTLLYVDLIVGHSKTMYSNAFMDSAPYDELLQYTSYSYVTGKPGMDPSEWAEKKKAAREAKAAIKERSRMQSKRAGLYVGRTFSKLTGGNTATTLLGMASKLNKEDRGILSDASYDQLVELAGKYGIDPTSKENVNINVLKAKIYSAMASESKRIKRLQRRQSIFSGMGIYSRRTADMISAHSNYSNDNILGIGNDVDSSKIPILHFEKDGKIKENIIDSAVAVYLVGTLGNGQKRDISEATKNNSVLKLAYGNKYGNYSAVTDKSDLPENEEALLDYVMSLPLSGHYKEDPQLETRGTIKMPKTFQELVWYLIDQCGYGANMVQDALSGYDQKYGVSSNHTTPDGIRKYRAVWLLAKHFNMKKLQSYAESQGGKITGWLKGNVAKKTGLKLLSIISLGGARFSESGHFRGSLIGNSVRDMKHTRWPESQADLSQKELEEYIRDKNCNSVAIAKQAILSIIPVSKQSHVNEIIDRISTTFADNNDIQLNIYRAAIAGLHGCVGAMRLIMLDAGFYRLMNNHARLKVNTTYRIANEAAINFVNELIKKDSAGKLKTISRHLNGFLDAFKSRNTRTLRNLMTEKTSDGINLIGDTNLNSNPNTIPKIKWNPDMGNDDIVKVISEVIPVYVVNKLHAIQKEKPKKKSILPINLNSETDNLFRRKNTLTAGLDVVDNSNEYSVDSTFDASKMNLLSTPNNSTVSVKDTKTKSPLINVDKLKKGLSGFKKKIKTSNMSEIDSIAKNTIDAGEELSNLAYINAFSKKYFTFGSNTIQPVYVTNNNYRMYSNIYKLLAENNDNNNTFLKSIDSKISSLLVTLASPFAVAAPMGTGTITSALGSTEVFKTKAQDAIKSSRMILNQTMERIFNSVTNPYSAAHTGGKVTRFATGGTSISRAVPTTMTTAIVGDSTKRNIFANGAKPEIVQSTGDISVTPLNTQATTNKQKITKLTQSDRKNAMTTAISSHIIKYNYQLPSDVEEISNIGEAIKVYDVKPGINDQITINGTTTTIADILMTIATQLTISNSTTATNSQLLAAIAKKPIAKQTISSGSETPFTSNLSDILAGE